MNESCRVHVEIREGALVKCKSVKMRGETQGVKKFINERVSE